MLRFSAISLKRLSALLVVTILLVGTVSTMTSFAAADDNKNKKPQTLAQLCSKLDDKDDFKSLVCVAILNISNTIQGLQDQITHIRLVQFPQRCPPGQEMVGIDVQGKILCEISTAQSQTSVIVTLSQTSIQVDPHIGAPPVLLTGAAIGLSPNTEVTIDDGFGNVFLKGSSDNKGAFSWPLSIPSGTPPGNFFIHVTDKNGRTGAAELTITLPPLPPPPAVVTLTPTSGPIGTDVLITSTGLTPSDIVTVSVMGIPVASGQSDSTGGFSLHYIIPATINSIHVPAGTYTVSVTDQHGITGSAPFTVQ